MSADKFTCKYEVELPPDDLSELKAEVYLSKLLLNNTRDVEKTGGIVHNVV